MHFFSITGLELLLKITHFVWLQVTVPHPLTTAAEVPVTIPLQLRLQLTVAVLQQHHQPGMKCQRNLRPRKPRFLLGNPRYLQVLQQQQQQQQQQPQQRQTLQVGKGVCLIIVQPF